MKIPYIQLLIVYCILMMLGCTGSPAPNIDVSPTEISPTKTIEVDFDVTEIPKARSFSLATGSDGSLYLIYGQDQSLFVSRSRDGDKTFDESILASGNNPVHILPIEHPAIAVDQTGRVAVAWLEMPPDFHGADIWYAVSENGGETFSPGKLVASEPEGEVAMVQVALDGVGNPVLVWLNGSELKFTRSFDNGSTFSKVISIGDGSCECCQPQVIVIKEAIHIAYRSLEPAGEKGDIRDIVMIHSADRGETFQPVTRVSDEHWYLPACPIAGPSLAVHDGSFYIAWMDGRLEPIGAFSRGDIWLAFSQDSGKTFSPNIRINPDESTHHTLPSIAIGPGGRIHIAWEAQGKGDAFLYYIVSDDGGKTFTAPQTIADNSDTARGNPGKPVIVVDQRGNVTLAWLDRLGVRLANWTDMR
jgi:hypothetical protein